MKYCSICKQTVQPIRNYNAGIFWLLFVVGLFVVSPIIFISFLVENHVPTIQEYGNFIIIIIVVAGVFGIVPSILYLYLSEKTCPMCNSS